MSKRAEVTLGIFLFLIGCGVSAGAGFTITRWVIFFWVFAAIIGISGILTSKTIRDRASMPLLLFIAVGAILGGAIGLSVWFFGFRSKADAATMGTTLVMSLQPASNKGAPSAPIQDAQMRLENHTSETDRNIYIRVQGPPINRVVIDNPERLKIIGGDKGWILNPTANLELVASELLPHEVRTVYVYVMPDANHRADNWTVFMRSDNHPDGREALWPLRNGQFTKTGVEIFRIEISLGQEQKIN
jgi:hypothetical protein